MKKNAVKLSIYVISALIGFSLILCLAVFGVLACSVDSCAEARDEESLWMSGTFSQLIHSYDGVSFENSDGHWVADVLELDQYTLYYGSSWFPAQDRFISGHDYVIRFKYYNYANVTSQFYFTYPTSSGSTFATLYLDRDTRSGSFFVITSNVSNGYLCSFSLNTQYVGISDLEIVDITNLTFGTANNSHFITYYITDETSYLYYFGGGYHSYVVDANAKSAKYYSLYGAYDLGYENGYQEGYEEGGAGSSDDYQDGYDAGYDFGYEVGYTNGSVAILDSLAAMASTSYEDFPNGYQTYSQRGDGAYYRLMLSNTCSVGWSDLFPDYTFAQLQSLGMISSFYGLYGISEYTLAEGSSVPQWVANSYTSLSSLTYFQSYDTFFDNSNNSVVFKFSILGATIPSTSNPPLTIILFSDHMLLNVQYQDVAQVDNTYQCYTFNFPPSNMESYQFTFFTSSDALAEMYHQGTVDADNRVNYSSASYAAGRNSVLNNLDNFSFYSLIDSVVLAPFKVIDTGLDFDIPVLNINIRDFLMSLFSIAIVLAVLRFILGHS